MTTRALASPNIVPSPSTKKQPSDLRNNNNNNDAEDGIGHSLLIQEAGRSKIRLANNGVLWASDVRDKDRWEDDSHSNRHASAGLTIYPASSPPRMGDAEAAATKKIPAIAEDGFMERKNRSRLLQESVSQGVRQAQFQQHQHQQQQQHQQHQHQQQHQQKQQTTASHPLLPIRWERFLPQQKLRVLLVEDDDSTRHVVSALLRNCSYEVTSAVSGLMAWGLLMERTCPFDIILTEVVMPGLSGIGLLSRIIAQESLKHIPVVMMSSHDSMGIVFKCLSKGAVDFLVKPVRKNELKNLWQHVWRRCQSSSGSGSDCGSGSQTREAGCQSRAAAAAANGCSGDMNSNGNTDSDNNSSGLNLRGGSDNGSGTQLQGPWTKRAIEVESSQNAAASASASASKVELPKPGLLQYAEKGCSSQPFDRLIISGLKDHGHDPADKSNTAAAAAAAGRQNTKKEVNFFCDGGEGDDKDAERGDMKRMEGDEQDAGSDSTKGVNNVGGGGAKGNGGEEQQGESADVAMVDEAAAEGSEESEEEEESEAMMMMMMMMMEKHESNSSPSSDNNNKQKQQQQEEEEEEEEEGKFVSDSTSPSLHHHLHHHLHHEPPLKNARLTIATIDAEPEALTTSSALRHSCSSAFSRYNSSFKPSHGASQTLAQGSSGVGSNSQMQQRLLISTDGSEFTTPLRHGSHTSNNCKQQQQQQQQQQNQKHEDGISTAAKGNESQQLLPLLKAGTTSLSGTPGNAALQKRQAMLMEKRAEAADDCCISFEQSRSPHNQRSQIHLHTHHHSHHHHHHVQHHFHYHHKYSHQHHQERPSMEEQEEQESQTVTNLAPGSGPSSLLPSDPGSSNNNNNNNENNNNNNDASATGSNNGSNGHSNDAAQSAAADALPCACNEDIVANNNGDDGAGNSVAMQSQVGMNRSARREAALTKFRQKRKERCFEKKVRYQSRKRLAEQRPRVRGQFVRQSAYDFSAREPPEEG